MNAPETDKKIIAMALEGAMPVQAMARYVDRKLFFVGVKRITGNPAQWVPDMEKLIEDRIAKDWVVLIEDRTNSFSNKAILWDFDRTMEDGRTALQLCLDWYFALQARGALILPESMNTYALRAQTEGAMIDLANDEKGRLLYKVDWRKFSCGHKAVLMCVAGAIMEDPMSDRWLHAFCGLEKPRELSPLEKLLRHVNAITVNYCVSLSENFEAHVQDIEERKNKGAENV